MVKAGLMRMVIVVAGLVVFSSCTTARGLAVHVRADCNAANMQERYFSTVFGSSAEVHEADARGVPTLLAELGEPPLACGSGIVSSYRLSYLPEGTAPLVITVSRVGSKKYIVTASSRSDQGSPLKQTSNVDAQAWTTLNNLMSDFNFWSRTPTPMPSSIKSNVIFVHGPSWLLEARDGVWYHAISRVSASKEAGFDAPARAFFQLVGRDVPNALKPQ
jgi:hypothetical protein